MFNAGATTGSYTVTAALRGLSVSALVNAVTSPVAINNKREAESFSTRRGRLPATLHGRGRRTEFRRPGLWVTGSPTDNLNVPAAGVYTVSVRVNSTAAGQIGIGYSGVTFGLIDVPNTGGTWQTVRAHHDVARIG